MKGKIAPDDLRRGMYVVVTDWLDEWVDEDYHYCSPPPKKPIGSPFKILAVALPFITIEALAAPSGSIEKQRGVFDVRAAELMEVDLAYVRSLLPGFKPSGSRAKSSLSKDDRIRKQRYFSKEGTWKEILEEPR